MEEWEEENGKERKYIRYNNVSISEKLVSLLCLPSTSTRTCTWYSKMGHYHIELSAQVYTKKYGLDM